MMSPTSPKYRAIKMEKQKNMMRSSHHSVMTLILRIHMVLHFKETIIAVIIIKDRGIGWA